MPEWRDHADIDDGVMPGLSGDERVELAERRRRNRVLEIGVEIAMRANACFARENILPGWWSRQPT